MAENNDFPVYLFTGFLESGKTKFIQETLEDKRFCNGERTLLLVCEEGEEEYSPDEFAGPNVFIRTVEDQSELTEARLTAMKDEVKADRAVVEYNGMWMLDALYQAMPESWAVYQEFMFADANTFVSYNANMRQLCYDKLKSCELVVFNRFTDKIDKMELHKIVRAANRRADIAYEDMANKVTYDDIEDPLPFDVNADIIKINDEDFALWYRDMSEEPKKYDGKKIQLKVRALQRKSLPGETFAVGRHVMNCCAADIQFAALVCQWKDAKTIRDDSWMILTAELHFKFSRVYGRKGPVLTYISHVYCEPPVQDVATFY